MIYNQPGKSGIKISAISFGTMRWESEEACHSIIARGMELGMNYIDTSTGYVGGKSIVWSGSAIKNRRSEIYCSSKSNWDQAPDETAVRKAIEEALKKAGLDYFDFYQVWGLQRMEVLKQALAKNGMVQGVRQAQKEGLIKVGLGFTFHGDAATFKTAVDSKEFLCTTVSYSLLNRREEKLIDYAAAKGLGVIIMNPLAGGLLGKEDDPALAFLRKGGYGPWYGSLRFLLANKNITTSIVGYASLAEVDKSVKALENPKELTEKFRLDLGLQMAKARLMEERFCTGCGYCHECPHGFDPTHFMQVYRDFFISGAEKDRMVGWMKSHYVDFSLEEEIAKCAECRTCEEKCPQHLQIVESINKVKTHLGK